MQLIIIRDDGIVGVDGVFRQVDLSELSDGIRVLQWEGTSGWIEFYSDGIPNEQIINLDDYQIFIDRWNAKNPPEPQPPTPEEMIADAHARINADYQDAVDALTAGYPEAEIASWPKQETEARAWLADNGTPTPWIDAAAIDRGITKADFVALIIGNADALAPMHGALTGKRQRLRDEITALGVNPTQEQLDAIQW